MKIKIKSLDNFNQNYEKLFELKKVLKQEEKKEYHYSDEFGKCRIIEYFDFVEIYRVGKINSKQVFKLNKKTSFSYITKEFKGKYEIITKKIFKENGKIMLEYDIMDRSELINTIRLEINLFV